jgi:hypothetical protein
LALRSAFRILALPKILRLGNAQINLALRSAFRILALPKILRLGNAQNKFGIALGFSYLCRHFARALCARSGGCITLSTF